MDLPDETYAMTFQSEIDAALNVMQAHIDALNAKDPHKLAQTLHFPHNRLSGTNMKTWETPDHYFADFLARAGGDWAYSRFEDIRVVHASSDKVHLDARIDRFNASDRLISSFRSLWIITLENGTWAARLRSSFAAR